MKKIKLAPFILARVTCKKIGEKFLTSHGMVHVLAFSVPTAIALGKGKQECQNKED